MYDSDPDTFTTWCNILKRVPDRWGLGVPPQLLAYIVASLPFDHETFTTFTSRCNIIKRVPDRWGCVCY